MRASRQLTRIPAAAREARAPASRRGSASSSCPIQGVTVMDPNPFSDATLINVSIGAD